MCSIAKMGINFTELEAELLTNCFDNLINEKRNTWNVIVKFQQEQRDNENPIAEKAAKVFRNKLEGEVKSISMTVVAAVNEFLLPNSVAPEEILSYHHMIAEYMWTVAEFFNSSVEIMKVTDYGTVAAQKLRWERNEAAKQALEVQEAALHVAKSRYPPASLVCLSVALTTSIIKPLQQAEQMG